MNDYKLCSIVNVSFFNRIPPFKYNLHVYLQTIAIIKLKQYIIKISNDK